jgi:hypothetical protein
MADRIEIEWAATGPDAQAQRDTLEADLRLLRRAAGDATLELAPLRPEDHDSWMRMLRDAIEAAGLVDTAALLPEADAVLVTGSFDPAALAETLRAVTCGSQHEGLVLDATQDHLRILKLTDWPPGMPDFVSQGPHLQQLDLCRAGTSLEDVTRALVALSEGATPAEALKRPAPTD